MRRWRFMRSIGRGLRWRAKYRFSSTPTLLHALYGGEGKGEEDICVYLLSPTLSSTKSVEERGLEENLYLAQSALTFIALYGGEGKGEEDICVYLLSPTLS